LGGEASLGIVIWQIAELYLAEIEHFYGNKINGSLNVTTGGSIEKGECTKSGLMAWI
jgi:hypothetical protein